MKGLPLPKLPIMLRLHLLRHAEPLLFGSFSSDKERPLSEHGLKQCKKIKENLQIDWENCTIWCSSAVRTRQTVLHVIESNYCDAIIYKNEMYHAPVDVLFHLITHHKGTNELFLIGHNNGITDLLDYLSESTTVMQTGPYVCLEFPLDHWMAVSRSMATVVREFVP